MPQICSDTDGGQLHLGFGSNVLAGFGLSDGLI